MGTVTIPSFDWSAFYYPQILESLLAFKRINVPEHTDESPQDALIQLLRAFALVGHLNSVNADIVANENTLPTAHLPETVRNMLRLIGYELASAAPAQADIVFKLSAALESSSLIVPQYAQVATRRTSSESSIVYEILESLSAGESVLGAITSVFGYVATGSTYTDYTSEANSGSAFTPWTTPAARDCLYIGHADVMWNQLGVEFDTYGAGINGIWEYYSGTFLDAKPDSVAVLGTQLRFDVNSLLGTIARPGTVVRVQLDSSGVWEECVSLWGAPGGGSNRNYIETTGLLGQTVDQAEATSDQNYTIGSLWKELSGVDDATEGFTDDGNVAFTLPENLTQSWQKVLVNGVTCYWIRFRILSVATPTAPIFTQLRIDEGGQYVKAIAVQGQRQSDVNLGLADGTTADLEYQLSKEGFIDESDSVQVDSVTWTRVAHFLQSNATSRHYRVVLGESDKATILFGNGINGAIPSGQVDCYYRYGVTINGNVGANTISIDKTGLSFVTSLWNPRPAVGWQEAESASDESLERAKILGPASFRNVLEVALGPSDVETLTMIYTDPDTNTRPFIRSRAIENRFGYKTIGNVVVSAGGGAAPAEALEALDKYFNGDPTASPPKRKRVVANQEVTSINYSQRAINISATIYGAVSIEAIRTYLTALIQPEALMSDGVTFQWQFGQDVYLSRIFHEIHQADKSVYRIDSLLLNGVAASIEILDNELPVAGTITLIAGA